MTRNALSSVVASVALSVSRLIAQAPSEAISSVVPPDAVMMTPAAARDEASRNRRRSIADLLMMIAPRSWLLWWRRTRGADASLAPRAGLEQIKTTR